MEINNVGYKFTHKKGFFINRPNGSGDYVILFLRTGAVFTLGGCDVEAFPNSFILYKKGTPQFFRANSDSFVNDWIHFDLDENEENKLREMGIPFDSPTELGDITFFSKIIKTMYQEKYSVNRYKDKTLSLYFDLISVKLAEKLNPSTPQIKNNHYEKLAELRARIYNYPSEEWNVSEMARSVALSESYFQHLYKDVFETSIIADVIASRIERAQFLLSSTHYSIGRIANECGYKNDVHFMRQFKREVGVSPSEYRNSASLSENEVGRMRDKAPYKITVT